MPYEKNLHIFIAAGHGKCHGPTFCKKKEVQYISGKDATHTTTWDFYCTGGRNSGKWASIPVPSHWEQHGFGNYNFGRDNATYGKNFRYADEVGLYKTKFAIPVAWQIKRCI